MVELDTVLSFIQATGIIVGVAYYIMNIRTSQKNQQLTLETRQAQLFMQIYSRMHDYEFAKIVNSMQNWEWTDVEDFENKYVANEDENAKIGSVGMFYEGIGVLIERGLIDPTFVDDLMSGSVIQFWEKLGPMIYEIRDRYNFPQAYEYVEYLYKMIKPIVEKQHPELVGKTIGEPATN